MTFPHCHFSFAAYFHRKQRAAAGTVIKNTSSRIEKGRQNQKYRNSFLHDKSATLGRCRPCRTDRCQPRLRCRPPWSTERPIHAGFPEPSSEAGLPSYICFSRESLFLPQDRDTGTEQRTAALPQSGSGRTSPNPGSQPIETADPQAQQILHMQQMGIRRTGNHTCSHIPHGHIVVDVIDKRNRLVYQNRTRARSAAQKRQHCARRPRAPLFCSFKVLVLHLHYSCI